MDLKQWFGELQKLSLELFGFNISDNEIESWECYYSDDYTVREALQEDVNNA